MIKPDTYKTLGLNDAEYGKILELLGREPSTTELAMFSVQWSEHCGYTRSRNLLKKLPKQGKYQHLVGEDSGGIVIDDIAIIFKMESHNHPSQIEPKQGAATGVGGIIRDIFTAGARPIASLNSLRFGLLSKPYNRYLLKGVVDGIQFYGNCLGVPTVGGEIYFDESYDGNCLVNAMSIGIAKRKDLIRAQAKGVGNAIIYAGASTGRDGIGGCSVLASKELCEDKEHRPAVQIGDPFTEKCLIEATLEALATGHVVGLKDMGAAGLTCCTSEMASAGDSGMKIDLGNVPRKEKGMQEWELMMSESQERMLLCVKKGKEREIKKIFNKWGLQAQIIGRVTSDGMVCIKDNKKLVANVRACLLTDGPAYDMPYKKPRHIDEMTSFDIRDIALPGDLNKCLLDLLSSPSICSKRWVYEQYDHMVQTNTVVLPGSDSSVIRLKGTKKAIAATTDCNSRYCYLNPYIGAQIAIAEAVRNLICSGADPAAVTDCLNFGNPEKPEVFWYFKNCIEGIIKACEFFKLPVVSGNVSFYNESPKSAVYPTPTIGMIGIIDDIKYVCTQYFKNEADVIVLLGDTKEEFGGSEYLKQVHHLVRGNVPALGLSVEKAVDMCAYEAIRTGLVCSAHDCSEGGLGVCIAESCISDPENMIGAVIDNLDFSIREDAVLFAESQSRIVLSCSGGNARKIKEIASRLNAPFRIIGKVGGSTLKITKAKEEIIDISIKEIHKSWAFSLERLITSGV
jgi:phosphoribosylformylglycinamidine synthase subunit PurL